MFFRSVKISDKNLRGRDDLISTERISAYSIPKPAARREPFSRPYNMVQNGYPLDARFAPAQKCRWPSRYFQIREEPFSRIYGHVLRWQT